MTINFSFFSSSCPKQHFRRDSYRKYQINWYLSLIVNRSVPEHSIADFNEIRISGKVHLVRIAGALVEVCVKQSRHKI